MNWIYFRKISFPTIEVGAFHAIHCIIHLFFWRRNFNFGRLQIDSPTRPQGIILIFSSFLHLKDSLWQTINQNEFVASIASGCEKSCKSCLGVLKDIAVEKMIFVTIDQKSCKRILICRSACFSYAVRFSGCFAFTIILFQECLQ